MNALCSFSQTFFGVLMLVFTACSDSPVVDSDAPVVDVEQLLLDLTFLSSDDLEGRRTGTDGSRAAAEMIGNRFHELGLGRFNPEYRQPFRHENPRTGESFETAVNLVGYLEGRQDPDRFIVVTAHYDHLGVVDGEIYNGADDNASGTAGLLEIARWFAANPPESSMLFVTFDAEEQGLGGSAYFVDNSPVPLDSIVVNVNLDMISNSPDNKLFAVGTSHYGFLKPFIIEASEGAPVQMLFGYDTPEAPQDWTFASDHGPFHQKGIPFIYFGVEDHPQYHRPGDTAESIQPDFFVNATETILAVVQHLDQNLEQIDALSNR
ncbi:MAG: M28 family peptidase [Balneolaceae bacterium]